MIEGLYNLLVLAETGVFSYLFGKYSLDYLWESFLYFAVAHNLLADPEVGGLVNGFEKVDE